MRLQTRLQMGLQILFSLNISRTLNQAFIHTAPPPQPYKLFDQFRRCFVVKSHRLEHPLSPLSRTTKASDFENDVDSVHIIFFFFYWKPIS